MSVSTPGPPPPMTPPPPQHSGPPPRVDVLRSPQGLATAVTVLLCVAAGVNLLMVAAAVLAVRFVRKLTAMQHTMAVQGPYATA
ncbi:hypothetical protein [Streptomyces sp. NPDC041003]|uniref:hypothetical protein n=1 Tax=Streptomyces sp. NPDC041003 TaxID=3155730 RepID=UPI0033EF65A0